MKISTRNRIPGVVKTVTPGAMNSEVIVPVITKRSAARLALRRGSTTFVVVNASNALLATD